MIAFLGAVVVGLALGLLGSGGSILTVPILVHGVGRPLEIAVAESLWIVAFIAAAHFDEGGSLFTLTATDPRIAADEMGGTQV